MISVLILTDNGQLAVERCLQAIEEQSSDEQLEILILDNGALEWPAPLAGNRDVKLLRCPGANPAKARNQALDVAGGEIVCFTDASCLPKRDWIVNLTAPFADERIVGVKGAYDGTGANWMARFIQLEHEMKYERLKSRSEIDFVDMYSAAYRRGVLLANGGFDERFDRLEEQELSYRLAARGYGLVFRPEALVRHDHDADLWTYVTWKATIGFWKAQVNRFHPNRAVNDSYTPQALRLQIGSLVIALISLLLGLMNRMFLIGLPIAVLLFVATAAPFVAFAWPNDRRVAAGVAPMLVARALALASGYAWGILRPPRQFAAKTHPGGGLNYLTKRLIDLTGSVIGLVFTAALFPLLALLIKLDSPGPIIFRQRRVGQGGRIFMIYKFRTMVADAEGRLGELLDLRHLDSPAFKLVDDPRITSAGRFLRRWSLDELPQFWNVLRGDMSLVGPRPEEEKLVAMYSDWHRRRLEAKPGMTGPMQIHGRADLSLDERVRLEIDYIQEYTLWRDMKILLQTIPSLLKGDGAR